MVLLGGIIGLAAAIGLGRLSQSLLFEVNGWDPLVITLATISLAAVAFAAGFLPARRAARIDPMRALRYE
jgi:ABC-type antimicrobial peptide transport system permease subunit